MNHLVKADPNRAITAYEDMQEQTPRGEVITTRRYYSSKPATKTTVIEVKHQTPSEPRAKKSEELDTISFMVLANSMCLFFLLILTFVKVLIG